LGLYHGYCLGKIKYEKQRRRNMARTIFYSWQNDLSPKDHRYFIDKCIRSALKGLEKDVDIYMEYDRDTMGLVGSPDIASTIFEKIDKSVMFICDVSIINAFENGKKTPNPNVLIELGYAANKLGWDRIICLFDSTTGEIDDLPFDLRQKRITPFIPNNENEAKRVTGILTQNIKDLFVAGKLFNPLNDYMKGKIDKAFLDIAKQLANLMFGTYTLSDGSSHIKELLDLSYAIILDRMCICEFPAFIVLNTYEETASDLRDILKDLFSSSFFPKEWAYSVLELIDWIHDYSYFSSQRNRLYPFEKNEKRVFKELAVISGTSINPSNPVNSMLVLETYDRDGKRYIDTDRGKVINTTQYPCEEPTKLSLCYTIKPMAYPLVAKRVFGFITLCKNWLNITDSEFILNPDYYLIT
jgi:hypothetical protein